MKKFLLIFGFLFFIVHIIFGQQIRPMPSSQIYQKLEQLNTMGTVMYFAAHPDDENTRMMAYLVHQGHLRTIYYSLTRGDGGQNILGNEQGAALGLIRTHELLQARKLDGAEQMFSPFVDFGYTTSVPETFTFWSKQKLIEDAVKAIQETHPDIIICRFPTTGEGGHGQHTASAIVAKEAWLYIKNYNDTARQKLWLPKRLLFNSFHFGSANTIKPGQFEVRINQYDPLLGQGLGELAGKSRSEHKSQGAGTPQIAGVTTEHFELIEGAGMTHSLYDGIDTSWNRIGQAAIGQNIQKVIRHFQFTDPSASIPELMAIRKSIEKLPDGFWKVQKREELNSIILSCGGIMAEALTESPMATPGDTLSVQLHIIARSDRSVSVQSVNTQRILQGDLKPQTLVNDSLYAYSFKIRLDKNEPITQPYWMTVPAVNDEYQFPAKYLGMPEAPNELVLPVVIQIAGNDFLINVPISYKKLDPVRGDVTQRLRVVPAISIEPTDGLFVYKKGEDKQVTLHIKSFKDVKGAALLIGGNHTSPFQRIQLPELKKGTDTFMAIMVSGSKVAQDTTSDYLNFSVFYDDKNYNNGVHLIDYPHIPELQYLLPSRMKKVPKDWSVAVQKVGYVEGVGDYVDDVLRLCDLKVEIIPEAALNNPSYLKQYDAIIVGIRALNTQKQMKAGMAGLLEYVHEGGTLILQYNKSQSLVTDEIGPYPITLSYNRVTDEKAPVVFTDASSNLLHFPNVISQNDFKGWVQERGLYFPDSWDTVHFKTLFSMHDAGKPVLKGSVLYTPFGKGQYIYTSLAFFRQLPDGNEGAIRLLMNFLSAGKSYNSIMN